jgi:tetratricopeptide (TPR) repeat protein
MPPFFSSTVFKVCLLSIMCCTSLAAQKQKKLNLDSIAKVNRAAKDDTSKAIKFIKLDIATQKNDPERSMSYAKEALEVAKKIGWIYGQGYAYSDIGKVYNVMGQPQKAFRYYDLADSLYGATLNGTNRADIKRSLKGKIVVRLNRALLYQQVGRLREAKAVYEKCFELLKDPQEIKLLINLYLNLGTVNAEMGDFAAALLNVNQALKLSEQNNFVEQLPAIYSAICAIYVETNEIEKGKRAAFKSLGLAEESNQLIYISLAFDNLCNIFSQTNKPDSAIFFSKKALEFAEKMQNKELMSSALGNLAALYSDQKKYKEAKEIYLHAIKMNEEIGDLQGLSSRLMNLSTVQMSLKDLTGALISLEKALSIAKKTENLTTRSYIEQHFWELYKLKGDAKKALEHYEDHIKFRDSLNSAENRKKLVKAELKYEYEKQAAADSVAHAKESEIKNVELKRQEAEIKAKKNQQYALFGGLFLVGLFSIFMYNRFKVTQKQKVVIEHQKEIVEEQKKIVEEKQQEILDSIKYAKRIQMAQIPSDKRVHLILKRMRSPD